MDLQISLIHRISVLCMAVILSGCAEDSAQDHVGKAKQALAEGDRKLAIIEFRNALQLEAGRAEIRVALGRLYLEARRFESATKELEKAYDKIPDEAWPHLARVYVETQAFKKALELFAKHDGDTPELRVLAGRAHFGVGEFDQAKTLFEATRDTDTPGALLGLGLLAEKEGDRAKAEQLLVAATKAESAEASTWFHLGRFLADAGQFERADTALAKFVESVPANANARAMYIQNLLNLGDQDQRLIKEAEEFERRHPKDWRAGYFTAIVAVREERLEDARGALRRALSASPNAALANRLQGLVSVRLGDKAQGQEHLGKYLNAAPADVEVRVTLGRMLFDDGDFEGWIRLLEAGLEPSERDPALVQELTNAYLKVGKPELASELAAATEEAQANTYEIRLSLAMEAFRLGNPTLAIEKLEKITEDFPDKSAADILLVFHAAQAGDIEKAKQIAQSAAEQRPDSPHAHYMLGSLYRSTQDWEAAIGHLNKALELDPSHLPSLQSLATYYAINEKDLPRAKFVLDQALAVDPKSARTQTMLALLLEMNGDRNAAMTELERIRKEFPMEARIRDILVERYITLNQPGPALTAARESHRLTKASTNSAWSLAHALWANGQLAESRQILEKLVEAPKNLRTADATELLARVLKEMGHVTDSRKHLQTLVDARTSTNINALLELGTLHARTGDVENAQVALEQLLRVAPESAEAMLLDARIKLASGNRQAAYATASRVDSESAHWPASQLLIATIERAEGRFDDAIARLDTILMRYPLNQKVNTALSQLRLGQGKLHEELERIAKNLQQHPDNWYFHAQMGGLMLRAGNPKEAMKHHTRAVKLNPESAEVRHALAIAASANGLEDIALSSARRAVAIAPNDFRFSSTLAAVYQRQGQDEAARRALERFLADNPESIRARVQLAELYSAARRYESAAGVLKLTLEKDSSNLAVAAKLLQTYRRMGKTDEAERLLSEIQAAAPNSELFHVLRGDLFAVQGELEQALGSYRNAEKVKPRSHTTFRIARILLEQGKNTEALHVMSTWLVVNPQDLTVRLAYADALHRLGQRANSISEYEKALDVNPQIVGALNNLANIYLEGGEMNEALSLASDAYAQAPQDPVVADTMAAALFATGSKEKALRISRTASKSAPLRHNIRMRYIRILARLGDFKSARTELEDYLQQVLAARERQEAEELLSTLP